MYEPALNSLCFTDLQRLNNWQAVHSLQMYPSCNKGNVLYATLGEISHGNGENKENPALEVSPRVAW